MEQPPPPSVGDSQDDEEVIEVSVGDYVAVTPAPGFGPAEGVVVACYEEGFDLIQVNRAEGDIPGPTEVLWERLAGYVVSPPPQTLVRVYRGKQQADVADRLRNDAEMLSGAGYKLTTQSWAQGQWGCWTWLLAAVLLIVVFGVLVFLYLLIVKPDGTLTVTFVFDRESIAVEDDEPVPAAADPGAAAAPNSLVNRLSQLEAARQAGLITDEEHAAKRREIIAGL